MNKICTTIEQSKKLIELGIDVNTADMFWADGERPAVWNNKDISLDEMDVPAWSLAALVNVMRLDYYIESTLCILTNRFTYSIGAGYLKINTDEYDELVDACYEMFIRLKENDLL